MGPPGSRGVALVTVLGVVAVMTVLVLALFTMADTERSSARTYEASQRARHFADQAFNLTISQLRQATTQPGTGWASQPGMIRRFNPDGQLDAGFKLYSSSRMTVGDPTQLLADATAMAGWQDAPARFVDLNSPVVDQRFGDTAPRAWFPVVDPRLEAGTGPGGSGVEGFAIDADAVPGTRRATAVDDPGARLPMPVEWIYVLADGTIGTLDSSNRFQGPVTPTTANPIVGRVAFWADDETAKLNINTAAEGTPWDVPRTVGTEDRNYARFQPTRSEFQRYPGHPATTALSTVLMPGEGVSPAHKEWLYGILPRVGPGGSVAGTRVVHPNETDPDRLVRIDNERLFATSSEFLLQPDRQSVPEFSSADINRWDFVLTNVSRAPEVTLFNTPRIAIWPVDAIGRPRFHRTAFDNLIRFCATTGMGANARPYVFHRFDADSPTTDWSHFSPDIRRNRELYGYLQSLAARPVPGFGASLDSSWQQDRNQILTQVFDYIRTTNLCDDNHPKLYYTNEQNNAEMQTQFTNAWSFHHNVEDDANRNPTGRHWGHGHVAPIRINVDGDDTMGFGRHLTFSEFALHFIATADGEGGPKSGGIKGTWDGNPFYSNYPPLSNPDNKRTTDPYDDDPISGLEGSDPDHPGYRKMHWNYALPIDQPLQNGQRRIQAMLHLDAFTPGQGWNGMSERVRVRVTGLENLTVANVDNTPLFQPAANGRVIPFDGRSGAGWHGRFWGGKLGFRAAAMGSKNNNHNTNLLSNHITVDTASGGMQFNGGLVVVEIFYGPNTNAQNLIQRIELDFPSATFPIPELVTTGSLADPGIGGHGFIHARSGGSVYSTPEFWWSFRWDGSFGLGHSGQAGRSDGTSEWHPGVRWTNNLWYSRGRTDRVDSNPSYPWTPQNTPNPLPRLSPEYHGMPYTPAMIRQEDVIRSLVVPHGDLRLMAARAQVDRTVFRPHGAYAAEAGGGGPAQPRLDHLMFHNPAGPHWVLGFANDSSGTQLVPGANYHFSKFPKFPVGASQSTGDFDNGIANVVDGPYINKPDEGNTQGLDGGGLPYLDGHWVQAALRPAYFSPNRIIASPVMFGSLPRALKRDRPWETLLFRPAPEVPGGHPGSSQATAAPDHLMLDWFWMPAVEPWAVSDTFSTAGKVNLNYQIVPFTHITRATAVDALLKSEVVPAIPTDHGDKYKMWNHSVADYVIPPNPGSYRHAIDAEQTRRQFETRFAAGDIFRSATELCELHLVPQGRQLEEFESGDFWRNHALTGDNSRERPYAVLYPRVTTKSNSFRVHVRSQAIGKARGTDPAVVDPERDRVQAEWRGSALIERYLDPADANIPDYATDPNTTRTLDHFYRHRVLEIRRFNP